MQKCNTQVIADTEEELHATAEKIGVARKWHQGDHYDIARTSGSLLCRPARAR